MSQITLDDIVKLLPKPTTGIIELPSLGIFYDPSVVINGGLEIRPLSVQEEKLVAGMNNANVDDVIDTILSRCLITSIDINDLLLTDRYYMLLMLRANSYGQEYNFTLTCGSCSVAQKHSVNIPGDFTIKNPPVDAKEPFECVLPVSKITLSFRLLRGKDEKIIRKYKDKENKKGYGTSGDPGYIYSLALPIVMVNNQTIDIVTAMELISRLPVKDLAYFKQAIEENTPGVITTVTKSCGACGKELVTDLPMTSEFFRPVFTIKK